MYTSEGGVSIVPGEGSYTSSFFQISSVVSRSNDKSESIALSSDNRATFEGRSRILNKYVSVPCVYISVSVLIDSVRLWKR